MPKKKKMERAIVILQKRGRKALKVARNAILEEEVEYKPLKESLQYFMEYWEDALHPALVSLACEAVGGNPNMTTRIGAAIVLLAGGADIHDDIIDQSGTKGSKQTVFGKFGKDLSLLAGDTLILKGTYLLHEACEQLQQSKRKAILGLVKRAFFEISSAEAKETSFRWKTEVSGQEYLKLIRHKVAASEASARIGAMLGNATEKETEILGHYGRIYGKLLTIRDEIVDTFEPDELEHRTKRECLPLPIILAFHDDSKKKAIIQLLKGQITKNKIEKILDISIDCKETQKLIGDMKHIVRQEIDVLLALRHCKNTLELLLESTTEDL
jgi:geranylgeranyl diphosphate synthase type I